MTEMDWLSIAFLLGDSIERPVFVITAAGIVEMFNAAAERRLGWRRDDVLGKGWERSFADATAGDLGWFLQMSLRGGIKRWLLRGRTALGDRIVMDLAVSLTAVSGQAGGAVVCTVEELQRETVAARPDRCYEISIRPDEFGRITHVGGGAEAEHFGRRCYEVVAGRASRCVDCELGMRELGSSVGVMTAADGTVFISRAVRIDDARAQITYEAMEPGVVRRLLSTRLASLAARNQLSERELEVLNHLVVGRDVHDIADELEITPRTVRFHQANLLKKLRIDSRLELLRLLFETPSRPDGP